MRRSLACLLAFASAPALSAQVAEIGKFSCPPGAPGDAAGGAVAVYDDVLLVGAPLASAYGASSGTVWVFERDGGSWEPVAELHPDDAGPDQAFGSALDLGIDRALIAGSGEDGRGAAYVFERDAGGVWSQTAKLVGSDVGFGTGFGRSVSLFSTRAIVGAPYQDGTVGAAYLFERQANGTWNQVAKLVPSDPDVRDWFGFAVGLFDERVVVGAPREPFFGHGAAAYTFRRTAGGAWVESGRLTSGVDLEDNFGRAVSVYEELVLVGAPAGDANNLPGAAYAFEFVPGSGLVRTQLPADAQHEQIGLSVSLSGQRAVVGANLRTSGVGGAAFVDERVAPGQWQLVETLESSEDTPADNFGWSVSLDRDHALVGDIGADDFAGAAYLFDLEPLTGDRRRLPSGVGVQTLSLDAGAARAGHAYVVLGSMSGTSPGQYLPGGLFLPLERDPYFRARIHAPSSLPVVGGAGFLDAAGHATATVVPALPHVSLHGVTLQHAFVVLDAGGAPEFVSNAFPLALGF